MSKSFCLGPWFSLSISQIELRPCCLWPRSYGYKWNSFEDIKNYWYGERMVNVRDAFLHGIYPKECTIIGCLDRIQPRSEFYDIKLGPYINKSRLISSPPLKPLHIDFMLGNRCNLQCRMCGSWGSRNWNKNDKELNKIDKKYDRSSYDSFDLDITRLKNARDMFTDVIRFDFKGGEPMLYNSMIDMIGYLKEWNLTKEMALSYVTNGSIVNENAIKLWKNFKEIRLIMSLDGIDEIFHYIRGYDFKTFKESIEIYNEIENVKGLYNTTISIYNILDINKLNTWIMERKLTRFPCEYSKCMPIYGCNVTNPPYLDVRILPKKYKQLALKQFDNGYYKNMEDFISWLKSIQEIPEDREKLELFVSFTKFMDEQKGTNFLDIKPEFKELFEEYSA